MDTEKALSDNAGLDLRSLAKRRRDLLSCEYALSIPCTALLQCVLLNLEDAQEMLEGHTSNLLTFHPPKVRFPLKRLGFCRYIQEVSLRQYANLSPGTFI